MDRVERYPKPIQEALGAKVLPWLEGALQAHADDVEARNATAVALWTQGRYQEAAEVFDAILAKAPRRETTLHGAASLAMEMGRFPAARTYWEHAVEVNPYRHEFHYGLAAALAQTRAWAPAAEACQRALQLHIADLAVRQLLVRCYLELGQKDRAREEFERLLAMNPPDRERLRRWFEERAP
jgi:tetratricopeptide (TPR) repeat protein